MGLEQFKMLKPLLFTSLYAIAGASGWGAYTVINEEDTSVSKISAVVEQTKNDLSKKVISKNVYRYKDENGNWVYSEEPFSKEAYSNYESELSFLRSLPQEAMPTKAFKTTGPVKQAPSALAEAENGLSKLMLEAKRVAGLLESRNELLDLVVAESGNAPPRNN